MRWGGEEFLLVLQGCNLAEAARIAENLRQAVAQARIAGQDQGFSVSIGVSEFDGVETTDQAVNRADGALYQAKHGGRNRVCVASSA